MHGLSTTVVLLTIATFLDEILHLASILASGSPLKLHMERHKVPPAPVHQRPHGIRLWNGLFVSASPVGVTQEQQTPMLAPMAHNSTVGVHGGAHLTGHHATEDGWQTALAEPRDGNTIQLPGDEPDSPLGSNAPMGWADPRLRGGQMLDFVFPGLGEPLNVIISGLSDPYVLTPRGLLHYVQTLGFSTECLGIHLGMLHVANLGDALTHPPSSPSKDDPPSPLPTPRIPPRDTGGNKTEQLLARQNYDWPMYGWPDYGTCWESIIGGNHFRAWKQDGAGARTGAWFLAASREMWIGMGHMIAPDGYNGGRDQLVKRALKPTRWSPTDEGIWWKTSLKYNTTLIPPGNQGINHKITQDGRVAILTVRRRNGPPKRRELLEAWGELAQGPEAGLHVPSWLDWDARADARRARWELDESVAIQSYGS